MFTDRITKTLEKLQAAHGITGLPGGTSIDIGAPYSRADEVAFNDALDSVLRDFLDVRHIGSGLYVCTAPARHGGIYPDGETVWSAYYDEAREAFNEWVTYESWEQFCEAA